MSRLIYFLFIFSLKAKEWISESEPGAAVEERITEETEGCGKVIVWLCSDIVLLLVRIIISIIIIIVIIIA